MQNFDNKIVQILPNFSYRVAPKDRGLKYISRRLGQFLKVLLSNDFSSTEQMLNLTKARYASPEEIEFYMSFGKYGLIDEEKWIMAKLAVQLPSEKSCLVVGCGTGREVFGVESLGFSGKGLDNCEQMIEGALKLKEELKSQSEFVAGEFLKYEDEAKYDVVLLTFALLNHIPHKSNRVAYLKKAKSLLKPGGRIVMHCDEFPAQDNIRYHAASALLRLRWWKKGVWQPGDTVRAYLGTHHGEAQPLFYHYYMSHYELSSELQMADLIGWQFRRGWIIQDSSDENLPVY